jgi:rhomboid protease GluP
MNRSNDNPDEDLQPLLRGLDQEFGPRRDQAEEQPPPVYGEAQAIPQPRTYRLSLPGGQPRAIWVLLAVNIIVFVVPELLGLLGVRVSGLIPSRYFPQVRPQDYVTPSDYLFALGAKINRAIVIGEYYRFLTAMFLHAGLIHIGFNAYALYVLGPQTERIYGTGRFLALYFIAGLAGGVASYALNPGDAVGASGAIFGLIGGLAAFYYVARGVLGDLSRQQLGSLITVIMINLFIGFSTPVIDNTAHIGGLLGGAAVGWFLAPRFEVDTRLYPPAVVRRDWPLAWPGALGLLVLLVVLAMVINPPIR